MGRDILNRLYYGKIVPWENQNDKTPEMELLNDQIDADIKALERVLDDAARQMLERILENSTEMERKLICEGFKDGFRLGAQLAVEGLFGEKEL